MFDAGFFMSSQAAKTNAIVQSWCLSVDVEDTVTVVGSQAFWCSQDQMIGMIAYVRTLPFPNGSTGENGAMQPNTTGNIISAYAKLKLSNGNYVWQLQYVTPGAEKLFPQTLVTPPVAPQVATA